MKTFLALAVSLVTLSVFSGCTGARVKSESRDLATTAKIHVSVYGDEGPLFAEDVTFDAGSTVLKVTQEALEGWGEAKLKTRTSMHGTYVSSLFGFEREMDEDRAKGWCFAVNNERSQFGADDFALTGGSIESGGHASLIWYYGYISAKKAQQNLDGTGMGANECLPVSENIELAEHLGTENSGN